MKHTVILGSYNRPRMIQKAIGSVLRQTVSDFQLLITDDGSNEETIETIRRLIAADKRCALIRCATPLVSEQRTRCADRACERINDVLSLVKGNLVHYLADDDWYDAHRFAVFEELFANGSVNLGYGRLVYYDGKGQPTGEQRYFKGPVKNPLYTLDHNQVAHRARVFEQVPRWPTRDRGDYALEGHFFASLVSHYGPFYGIDRVVGYKRMHGLNMQWTQAKTTSKRED